LEKKFEILGYALLCLLNLFVLFFFFLKCNTGYEKDWEENMGFIPLPVMSDYKTKKL
jgi:hypothetical protein